MTSYVIELSEVRKHGRLEVEYHSVLCRPLAGDERPADLANSLRDWGLEILNRQGNDLGLFHVEIRAAASPTCYCADPVFAEYLLWDGAREVPLKEPWRADCPDPKLVDFV